MEQDYCSIEEALEDLRSGKLLVVIDDPDRENEGDLICAAQFATTENVNFMACYGRGLICTPMSQEVAIKFTFSVVANWAAQIRSPSFSRSGSSMTTRSFPLRRSSRASSMLQ